MASFSCLLREQRGSWSFSGLFPCLTPSAGRREKQHTQLKGKCFLLEEASPEVPEVRSEQMREEFFLFPGAKESVGLLMTFFPSCEMPE